MTLKSVTLCEVRSSALHVPSVVPVVSIVYTLSLASRTMSFVLQAKSYGFVLNSRDTAFIQSPLLLKIDFY